MKFVTLVAFCVTLVAANTYDETDVISSRIESCRGCSLNRLPEVKKFIFEDAPLYDRMEVKFITGAPPEFILLGEGDRELDRLPLSHMNRQECNDLVQSKGFSKKISNNEL